MYNVRKEIIVRYRCERCVAIAFASYNILGVFY